MSEMVERVADAIEARMGPLVGSPEYLADPVKRARAEKRRRDAAIGFARAAIEAMRIPTEAMASAGLLAVSVESAYDHPDDCLHSWSAMIDAALAD